MDNVRMKNVETPFLKLPEYKHTGVGASQVDIRDHAKVFPIFDLVTPKDEDDTGSVSDVGKH